ncbi:hypothetical protein LOK49_LG08G00325 [Camellia lanceoleosa]|uniref:Uncharacterized protein n=1 Tax=Camellia lanceoleosa TaxID=1840588 RepID=A0ACC0GW79_9ERIC|nr:hypothetical protein LOK49_LG08G00325 [Camellia lanceoleosa]
MEMIPHLSYDFQTFPEVMIMQIDDHCFLQCFYLATSYSLAGKRTEAYALYYCAHSLANDSLKKFKSLTTADQVMIKELKMLYDHSRSNSYIEHATGIIEKEKAPENLSKKISTISLTGTDKKVLLSLGFSTCLS